MNSQAPVDLRSDTVTKPSEAMRTAMASAEVGDDVFRDDPTVLALEEEAARRVGKEASLFMPTGTMGNQVAIRVWTDPGDQVLLEAKSHIFNYELGAFAVISGSVPRPIPTESGILSVADLEQFGSPGPYYALKTGLVSVETTHNMHGGTVYPVETLEEIHGWAKARDLPVHMDGARVFNAAASLGVAVSEITQHCESVMFCLSKGLGAPIGSILAGDQAFIDQALAVRKMLGGGMRQVGVVAAAGHVALEEGPELLKIDHQRARTVAEALAASDRYEIDPSGVASNIVIFQVCDETAAACVERFTGRGILCAPVAANAVRFVFHRDLSDNDIDRVVEAIREN